MAGDTTQAGTQLYVQEVMQPIVKEEAPGPEAPEIVILAILHAHEATTHLPLQGAAAHHHAAAVPLAHHHAAAEAALEAEGLQVAGVHVAEAAEDKIHGPHVFLL